MRQRDGIVELMWRKSDGTAPQITSTQQWHGQDNNRCCCQTSGGDFGEHPRTMGPDHPCNTISATKQSAAES
eukprot:15436898-Alexandrium_andersonii.AAC.1